MRYPLLPLKSPGFFINNQFRLIVDGSPAGSDNLEEVFEANLRRTGRVLAILDTWHQPTYLRRVWMGGFSALSICFSFFFLDFLKNGMIRDDYVLFDTCLV